MISAMLYIHVPFCRSKCAYCDFYSTPRVELMEGYVAAVTSEWAARRPEGWNPSTLYLGGGTPSSLPVPLLRRLVDSLEIDKGNLAEFTIEANPEDVTPEWVAEVRNIGAGRVSMGVQSFSDAELRFVGRRHTAAEALRAVGTLRDGGIDNISLDLIYGLPGQSLDSWQRSVDTMTALRPDHISAYMLSYEPRTRLGVMLARGKVTETADETLAEMYATLCATTREAGYDHYEISNFALPGRRAIHNSGYWDGRHYIGLGPGAHSYCGGVRGSNPADLRRYIETHGHTYETEAEEDNSRLNDMVITALRTSRGLSLEEVDATFAPALARGLHRAVSPLLVSGELTLTPEGRLVIPEDRWLLSDMILLKLITI